MRNFRYSMKALSLIEKSFNKPLSKIDFGALTIDETMTIIWAGLAHEDKELTPDNLIDIIDESGASLEDVVNAMSAALDDAFGSGKGNTENPTMAAQ